MVGNINDFKQAEVMVINLNKITLETHENML